MSQVTFMYWYDLQELGVEKLECVVAECSRCGLRVSAQGPADRAIAKCSSLFQVRCRLEERNSYHTCTFAEQGKGYAQAG